jgi:transketolase
LLRGDLKSPVLGCGLIKAKRQSDGRQGHARQEGAAGTFIGMTVVGASGPAQKLYEHFNIAAKAAVNAAWKQLLAHASTIASAECRN